MARALTVESVDQFAGAGGWDEGLLELGIAPLGIEWDDDACATRLAAGHRTLQADIATLDPHDFEPCELQLGSPPCQSFSAAGKRAGDRDMAAILHVVDGLAAGVDRRGDVRLEDPRGLLVVEPLRFALALRPELIALEQVPSVLPIWQRFAHELRKLGYWTWAGVLSAERYGVPQTRKRAILMASLRGPVGPPPPTHRAYVPGESAQLALDDLLPWVSMAEALGMGEAEAYSWTRQDGTSRRVDPNAPAPTVCGHRNPRWAYDRRQGHTDEASGVRTMVKPRQPEEPAPTIGAAGLRSRDVWVPADPLGLKGDDWPERRPATTITGDSRVFQPGGHHGPGLQSSNSILIGFEDAAVLQGFRRGYPWVGNRTSVSAQIGNAIPPPLARAIVKALL